MTLQPQKRSQTKPDVVTPRPARANLRPLDQTELLDAAVVVLYRPREAGPLDSLQVTHLSFIGRPPLNVAVCGDYLEHADKAITFEPHPRPDSPTSTSLTARRPVRSGLTLRFDFKR